MEGDEGVSKEEQKKRKARERMRERRADPEYRRRENQRRKILAAQRKASMSSNVVNTPVTNIPGSSSEVILSHNIAGENNFELVFV